MALIGVVAVPGAEGRQRAVAVRLCQPHPLKMIQSRLTRASRSALAHPSV